MAFSLLGSLELESPAGRFDASVFPSRKAKQVCQLIAIAGGQPVSKERVIDLLWGDRLPRHPVATVDHTVSILRRMLETNLAIQPIITAGGHYRLDLECADVDLIAFDKLAEVAGMAPEAALADLLAALDLVRGNVLEDEPYQVWAEPVRERYRQRIERVTLQAAELSLWLDKPSLALRLAEQARHQSALVQEEAYVLCASALGELNRRHEAMVLMHELERRLTVDFNATLSARAELVAAAIRQPMTRAAGTGPVTVATRSATELTSLPFVGRRLELDQIARAWDAFDQGQGGLVVVEGGPGSGKSRLLAEAVELAGRSAHRFTCLRTDGDLPLFTITRLLRHLAVVSGSQPVVRDTSAPAIYDALVSLIDDAGPMALVVDDLQWADAASLGVLAALLQPNVTRPLLVLAGRRGGPITGLPDPLVSMATVRIELGPLPRPTIESLPIESAWSESGGHPGLLAASVEGERAGGALTPTGMQFMTSWVDAAGATGRTLLRAAASLGLAFALGEVAASVGLVPTAAAELLLGPIELGLIRPTGEQGDRFELAGALLRRALLS